MLTIGLTGPTGAGKTTILSILDRMGCVCVDCDALYHRLLQSSPQLRGELTERFGRSILDNQGQVDRGALGGVVFGDPSALESLNAITHRHVVSACLSQMEAARAQGKTALALDAVALIESGLGALCDVTIAVTAPAEVRLRRIMARDRLDQDQARRRMDAQKPLEYYVNHCDHAIENDGTKTTQQLTQEVQALLASKLCQPKTKGGHHHG